MKSGPSEVLTQRPIIQHGLVDHMAKLEITVYSVDSPNGFEW